ncbi:hypothetical protein B0H15DRAFT_610886 [Mycena belliarum]|uniref:Uncharacterized protein n=1 Tax=Mycena belliarum TaxID=1033014 RepID=A0AAD6TPW7_9AGAR|nr:hypothetical protein B0H15DRAFT_610886 [Mycena belliae]
MMQASVAPHHPAHGFRGLISTSDMPCDCRRSASCASLRRARIYYWSSVTAHGIPEAGVKLPMTQGCDPEEEEMGGAGGTAAAGSSECAARVRRHYQYNLYLARCECIPLYSGSIWLEVLQQNRRAISGYRPFLEPSRIGSIQLVLARSGCPAFSLGLRVHGSLTSIPGKQERACAPYPLYDRIAPAVFISVLRAFLQHRDDC